MVQVSGIKNAVEPPGAAPSADINGIEVDD